VALSFLFIRQKQQRAGQKYKQNSKSIPDVSCDCVPLTAMSEKTSFSYEITTLSVQNLAWKI
jgi:hypothetical protein